MKNPPSQLPSSLRSRLSAGTGAFTLLELLLTVLVIAVLLAVMVPTMTDTMAANRLTNAGDQLYSLLSQAQQIASTEGRPVEVRFYKHLPTDTPGSRISYRTVVLMRHYDAGEPSPFPSEAGTVLQAPINVHHGETLILPEGVVIASSSNASTLLTLPEPADDGNSSFKLGDGRVEYKFPAERPEYRSFIFGINNTNLPSNPSDRWFVTLIYETDEEKGTPIAAVDNYYCLQVDPVNGRITSYRPN